MENNIKNIENMIKKYEACNWFGDLNLLEEKLKLIEIKEEVNNYIPKIAVIGEFSTGKSTLINSFIKMDILPAEFTPTTLFITEIKYSPDKNYIYVDGDKIELTKENLKKITAPKSNRIEVYINNPILKEYTFVDTPGTNDPATFTDDIVFELVGEVDVVLFLMNINQAIKDTEKQFISKLIRRKDIEKFFFVLNFAETIDNPRIVKKEVIDKLSSMLDLNKDILQTHTFVYSAKEALANRLQNIENESYEIFINSVNNFIKVNKRALLNEWLETSVRRIVGSMLLKVEALEDKITGNVKKYEEDLNRISEEMKAFEEKIRKELDTVNKNIKKVIDGYKVRVKDSFKYVYSEISQEVNNMPYEQLIGTRYIEMRAKKLIEDRIANDTKLFLEEASSIVKKFDEKIEIEKPQISIYFSNPQRAKAARTIVNLTALGAVGVAGTQAVSALPSLLPVALGGSGVYGALGLSTFIPVVGAFTAPIFTFLTSTLAASIPAIAAFALAAGKILFDIGKWGVGKIGDAATAFEQQAKKKIFLHNVKTALDKVEAEVISQIDNINISKFNENYISSKFPEKLILEEKMKMIESKQIEEVKLAEPELNSLNQFKNELILILGE